MISATRRWLRRNRTNFAVGAGVIGAGYLAGQYLISKFTEGQQRAANDRIAKENLRRRFQQNQEDCVLTVLELLPTVTENIMTALPSEKITHELQQRKAQRAGRSGGAAPELASSGLSSGAPSITDEDGKSLSSDSFSHASQFSGYDAESRAQESGKTKLQLWNELKITSITRVFTLLYVVSLLSMLTRIQLNLLGRKNYLSSVLEQVSPSQPQGTIRLEDLDEDAAAKAYGKDFETNRKYLTFSWWLLHRGWREIMTRVDAAVTQVFGPIKPTEDVSMSALSTRFLEVRRLVEGPTEEDRRMKSWLSYLLPPREQEELVLVESGINENATSLELSQNPPQRYRESPIPQPHAPSLSPSLRQLLDETSDLIESPMFTHVLTLLFDATFSLLVDQRLRTEAFKLPDLESVHSAAGPSLTQPDPTLATAKVAVTLATITKEAHKIGHGMPNEYVQSLENVKDFEAFAAVIYGSNLDAPFELGDHVKPDIEPDASFTAAGQQSFTDPIAQKAKGVVDSAWEGFENVWGRATE